MRLSILLFNLSSDGDSTTPQGIYSSVSPPGQDVFPNVQPEPPLLQFKPLAACL